jgi:hypothetical protein
MGDIVFDKHATQRVVLLRWHISFDQVVRGCYVVALASNIAINNFHPSL